jgi:hypothetical protein
VAVTDLLWDSLTPPDTFTRTTLPSSSRDRTHQNQGPASTGEWYCERFHKTVLDEFYKPIFRKNIFSNVEELQAELDGWLEFYNQERTHQGTVKKPTKRHREERSDVAISLVFNIRDCHAVARNDENRTFSTPPPGETVSRPNPDGDLR